MARRMNRIAVVGNLSLALALAAGPRAAHAQAFQGSGASAFSTGAAATIDQSVVNTTTVTVNANRTIINWTPSDNPASSAPFTFLPSGTTASFVGGSPLAGAPYTVLNRIIPNSAKAIQFDGTVNSGSTGRIWFYTPGGMIIGSSARFNVGSLLLTTADPVLDVSGNFMPVNGHFQLAGAAGSQSEIVIQSGAQLNAINTGQSNYIVALAPRIQQDGAISVRGSAALVAAEGATFAIDSVGLFTISVDAANEGSTVTGMDALSHSGSTGGPDSGSVSSARRVYLMAVPKNSAITMAIQSGGSLGFAIANAANVSGNAIVLSGGRNITDTGTGNPVTGASLSSQPVTMNIARGNYTSGVWAGSNDTINIADVATGGTPDIKFAGQMFASGNFVNMNLTQGANTVGGNLILDATGDLVRPAGTASLTANGSSTTLTVGGRVDLLARNGQQVSGSTSPAAAFTNGGTATLTVSGGAVLTATNSIRAFTNALGLTSGATPASGPSTGGSSSVTASSGGQIRSTAGSIVVTANGFGLTAAGASSTSPAIDAQGGTAQVIAAGNTSLISASQGFNIQAGGTGGSDTVTGLGGNATGGTAELTVAAGGRVVAGGGIIVAANGLAGNGAATGGDGGIAAGGTAQILVNDGTIADGTSAGFSATTINLEAASQGGNGLITGLGGKATGGNATLQTGGSAGKIDVGGAVSIAADATGGGANGAQGGSAIGGVAIFETTAAGQAIGLVTTAPVTVSAQAALGTSNGGISGDATAGTVHFRSSGGAIAVSTLNLIATAVGDSTSFNSGEITSGTVTLGVSNNGSITASGAAVLSAAATTSAETDPTAGSVSAGQIIINNQSGSLYLAGTTSLDVGVTVNGTLAPTDFNAGIAKVLSAPGTFTGFGTGTTGGGNIDIAQTTLAGTGDYAYSAAGEINLFSGAFSGAASKTDLSLRADSGATGVGTVNSANAAINLTGVGASTSFFYNPTAFGTPTDFSPAVLAGTWTGFQLVNNLVNLQNINNFLSQNFALGKSLDASSTIDWNAGLGFVPLGTDGAGGVLNGGNGFSGKFHGLGHVINGLQIERSGINYNGLFGYAGTGSLIRSVGLVGGSISGDIYTGGLVGRSYGVVRRAYSSALVTGGTNTGGLIGALEASGLAEESFSLGEVDGGDNTGGLVGFNAGDVVKTYSTGSVSGGSNVGGLIGSSNTAGPNSVRLSYATGDVQGSTSIGGLIGRAIGTVSESYASGAVVGSSAGGLFGNALGTFTALYWDRYSTGQGNAFSTISGTINSISSVTSDPGQSAAGDWAFSPTAYANFNGLNWYSFNSATRPVGLWEAPSRGLQQGTLYSAHRLWPAGQGFQAWRRHRRRRDRAPVGHLGQPRLHSDRRRRIAAVQWPLALYRNL